MSAVLTEEQKKRIEENRRKALQRKAQRASAGFAASSEKAAVPTISNPSVAPQATSSTVRKTPGTSASLTVSSGQHSNEKSNGNNSWTGIAPQRHYTSNNKSKSSFEQNESSEQKFKPTSSEKWFQSHNKNGDLNTKTVTFGGAYVTGGCRLISKDRFTVDVGYHSGLLDIFKAVPGRLYDPNDKKWNFPLSSYSDLMSKISNDCPQVSIGGLPKVILQTFKNPQQKCSGADIDLSRIEQTLLNALMPFQVEGVQFGVSKGGRILLADDMGLGKTIQALGIAHYYKSDWPLLIMVPSSVRYCWLEAIKNWLPSVSLQDVIVVTTSKDFITEAKVVIISYDLLGRRKEDFKHKKFGVIIADESHFLKNLQAARTKAAVPLLKKAKRAILLTGTPALSRPIELYSQISSLRSDFFSFQEFGIRYCNGKKNHFGWDFSGSSNMEELQLLLEERFMIRRLKSDVISQLPEKTRKMVILDPSMVAGDKKAMKYYESNIFKKSLKAMERRGVLLQYYNETGLAKLKAISTHVKDLLESGKKFICFAHHKAVLDGICSVVKEKNCKFLGRTLTMVTCYTSPRMNLHVEILQKKRTVSEYIRIDGTTSAEARKVLCDKFQFDDNYVVAALSITAAGTGITLTAAQLVVFAELFWNPGILTQAEDRAHRIGQVDNVVVQYLVAQGTADDHLWPLVQKKLNVLNKAGLSKDNFMDAHATELQDSKKKVITNYFEELQIEDDDDDLLLAGMEMEGETDSYGKRQKLDD